MAVRFSRSSTTSLVSSLSGAFATAVPFTFGGWFRWTVSDANFHAALMFTDTGTGNIYFGLFKNDGNTILYEKGNVATVGSFTLAAFSVGRWTHVIIRDIAAANYRGSALREDGTFATGNSTTSVTPLASAIDQVQLGNFTFAGDAMDGDIAEVWWAYGDFWRSDQNLPQAIHQEIAYNGPWVIPQLAQNLRWYWSFWDGYHTSLADRTIQSAKPVGSSTQTPLLNPVIWTPSATRPVWAPHPNGMDIDNNYKRLWVPGRRYFHVDAAVAVAARNIYNLATTGVGY